MDVTSTLTYPPDLNFLFARVIATHLRSDVPMRQNTSQNSATTLPPTATPAAPPVPSVASPPPTITADQPTPTVDATDHNVERPTPDQRTFKRTLGPYPLRSRGAALLALRSRRNKPQWGRNTGCAFATCAASTDPRTRKQAMADDRIGWGTAERAEIANHANNGSWTLID
eukprot:5404176-Pleurochrysis_carterae.AAC.1